MHRIRTAPDLDCRTGYFIDILQMLAIYTLLLRSGTSRKTLELLSSQNATKTPTAYHPYIEQCRITEYPSLFVLLVHMYLLLLCLLDLPPPYLLLLCHGPLPLQNLPTQALGRSFGLDDLLDAGAPALLEQAHLRRRGGLGGPARLLDGLDLVPGAGQVGLEVAQDGLELGVGDEPGVLAVALEQRQVGKARRQERRRRVGGAQRRAPGGRVGRVYGRVEGLVAR